MSHMRMKNSPRVSLAGVYDHITVVHSVAPPTVPRTLLLPLLKDDVSSFPTPKIMFNVYRVDAGLAMQGVRMEVVTLAKHRRNRTMHLVVLDCFTNTLQWNPIDGVQGPNAYCSQTRSDGRASWTVSTSRDAFKVDATPVELKRIDRTFAVEANLACYFQDFDTAYTMCFDEKEMRPVRVLSPSRFFTNTFWHKHRSAIPSHAFCHEHPMHFDVNVHEFDIKTIR